MQILNKEYCTRIEKYKAKTNISEDKFIQSATYKLLV